VNENLTPSAPDPEKPTIEALQREIEKLRVQLARKSKEADIYRETVYDLYRDQFPYVPMTEEEARELMFGPRAEKSIADLIAEHEQQLGGQPHAAG